MPPIIDAFFDSNVAMVVAAVYLFLTTATLMTSRLVRRRPDKHRKLAMRVRSWWTLVILFSVGVLLDETVALVFFGLLSYLALKEYFTMIPTRRTDRRIIFYAYFAIALQYFFIGIRWYEMFLIWIPVYLFLLLPFRQVLTQETDGFLDNTGKVQWGLMMFVFGLSHIAYLMTLPAHEAGDGKALVLYLVVLTELNDVFQYLWGKRFGRRKIVPAVSPGKTVEGFLLALVSTIILAWLLKFLTPFDTVHALFAGLIIGGAGFVGDVVISMVKRDIGVKDSGTMIPGHGGVLDRIDSLTYTAPLFFHYTVYFYFEV